MAPYFSIILPIYNVEPYLHRCVRSVLEQGFKDYELILVDDGATDGSPALCDALALQHSCIRVLHKENGGLSSARNAGLELARGQYIWWVDSDDWIEPEALQILYAATNSNQPDMVKFNYFRVEGEKQAPVYSHAAAGTYGEDTCKTLLDQACYMPGKFVLSAWSHLYRRDFLLNNHLAFVSERLVGSEDYLFNLESLLKAKRIAVLSDILYSYELRMGSLSQRYKKNLPEKYDTLYAMLREKYRQAGALESNESRLSAFYLWHLIRGTCIPNGYFVTDSHSMAEGRKEIRSFFCADTFREAYSRYDRSRFSFKKRLQLLAMKWQIEPLFYWLYVTKPRLKKGNSYENKGKIS